ASVRRCPCGDARQTHPTAVSLSDAGRVPGHGRRGQCCKFSLRESRVEVAELTGDSFRDLRTPMPLKVIGAGLPRTGTNSLQIALEQLGFGPCHHMYELLADPSQWPSWLRVYDGEHVDWEELYRGYNSAVDAPSAFLWRELAAAYPDAKVILTVRSPEDWR